MIVGMEHVEGEGKLIVDEIMKQDLADHGRLGRPYTILINKTVGRYMVAVRDIKPGELIMEERPLTFGPIASPVCLGCHKTLQQKKILCALCGWPMCSEKCSQRSPHVDLECDLFSKIGWRV